MCDSGRRSPPSHSSFFISPFISPTMPINTRKSNADVQPRTHRAGESKGETDQKTDREDNARAKAAAIAHREDEEGRNKCIAEVEDAMHAHFFLVPLYNSNTEE